VREPSQSSPLNVLFVCFGNACRSQMAEAFANHLGGGRVRAYSAGSHPLGRIAPKTYEAMQEKGLSLEGHWSKGFKDVPTQEMDVVVGMGCEVVCPVPPDFRGQMIEWSISDPYGADLAGFREVRDQIEREVGTLLSDFGIACTATGAHSGRSSPEKEISG
jgi:arsenate reductase (thioredoxin)